MEKKIDIWYWSSSGNTTACGKKMHVKKRSNNKKRNLVRVVAHEMGIESSLKNGGKKIRSSKPPTGSLCRSKSRNAKVNSVFSQVVLVWFKWNRLHDVT